MSVVYHFLFVAILYQVERRILSTIVNGIYKFDASVYSYYIICHEKNRIYKRLGFDYQ